VATQAFLAPLHYYTLGIEPVSWRRATWHANLNCTVPEEPHITSIHIVIENELDCIVVVQIEYSFGTYSTPPQRNATQAKPMQMYLSSLQPCVELRLMLED
jgi:hypothetical protein